MLATVPKTDGRLTLRLQPTVEYAVPKATSFDRALSKRLLSVVIRESKHHADYIHTTLPKDTGSGLYFPSDPVELLPLLRTECATSATRAFVVLGSGAGIAIVCAKEAGYRMVTGIEASNELCRSSTSVVHQMFSSDPRTREIMILNEDFLKTVGSAISGFWSRVGEQRVDMFYVVGGSKGLRDQETRTRIISSLSLLAPGSRLILSGRSVFPFIEQPDFSSDELAVCFGPPLRRYMHEDEVTCTEVYGVGMIEERH